MNSIRVQLCMLLLLADASCPAFAKPVVINLKEAFGVVPGDGADDTEALRRSTMPWSCGDECFLQDITKASTIPAILSSHWINVRIVLLTVRLRDPEGACHVAGDEPMQTFCISIVKSMRTAGVVEIASTLQKAGRNTPRIPQQRRICRPVNVRLHDRRIDTDDRRVNRFTGHRIRPGQPRLFCCENGWASSSYREFRVTVPQRG